MATTLFLEVHSVIKCINAYTIIFAILNYMDSFLISAVIIPLVGSGMVLGGLLSISIFQLPTIRTNMRREAVEQIYARIMDARMRLENNSFAYLRNGLMLVVLAVSHLLCNPAASPTRSRRPVSRTSPVI